jgi:hypothetical protein
MHAAAALFGHGSTPNMYSCKRSFQPSTICSCTTTICSKFCTLCIRVHLHTHCCNLIKPSPCLSIQAHKLLLLLYANQHHTPHCDAPHVLTLHQSLCHQRCTPRTPARACLLTTASTAHTSAAHAQEQASPAAQASTLQCSEHP